MTRSGSPSAEVYERLEQTTPEERTDIVLALIEAHPLRRLELPELHGVRANLYGLDLSPETIRGRYGRRLRAGTPPWWNAEFGCVTLTRANLQGANLFRADLRSVHLQYADMRRARLWMADLAQAQLLGADLTNASLMSADLQGASLVGACLAGAGLRSCNLRHANLEYCNLRGVNAWKTSFEAAFFRDAGLQGVVLYNSDLTHAHISGACLDEAQFSHQQFAGAIGEEVDGDYGWARYGYQLLERRFALAGDAKGAEWARQRGRLMLKRQARKQGQWGRLLRAQWDEISGTYRRHLAGLTTTLSAWLGGSGASGGDATPENAPQSTGVDSGAAGALRSRRGTDGAPTA